MGLVDRVSRYVGLMDRVPWLVGVLRYVFHENSRRTLIAVRIVVLIAGYVGVYFTVGCGSFFLVVE